MKIDKKDIVFIYEMDDIINSINDGTMSKKLKSESNLHKSKTNHVQVLQDFSRIMR